MVEFYLLALITAPLGNVPNWFILLKAAIKKLNSPIFREITSLLYWRINIFRSGEFSRYAYTYVPKIGILLN